MDEMTDEQALEMRAIQLADIDKKYGYMEMYDRTKLETEVRTHLENSAKSMLEAGKKLVLLKEHEGHGSFLVSLERIGVGVSIAQKMMKAAIKLVDSKLAKAETFLHLSTSKIHELVLLDDDDLNELAEGGSVAGLTLEDADKMSVRELKAELKKIKLEKANIEKKLSDQDEVHSQILTDKNKKIDDLDKKLRIMSDPSSWDEKAKQYQADLLSMAPVFTKATSDFIRILDDVENLKPKEWEQSQYALIEQLKLTAEFVLEDVDRIKERINFLAPEYNESYRNLKERQLEFELVGEND